MRKLLVLLTVVLAGLVASPGPAQAQPVLVQEVIGNYFFTNIASGKCLDLENWGQGRYVQQYSCHHGDNQYWQMVNDPVQTDVFEIKPYQHLGGNECLDVEHNGSGVFTQRYPCHLGVNQRWKVVRLGNGLHMFRSMIDQSKCLDASDWGAGVRVQIYPCHGGANQLWSASSRT